MPGAGADDAPGGAFYSPDATAGWKGRCRSPPAQQPAAPGELAGVRARAVHRGGHRARHRTPGDPAAQALAVGADGAVARYTPGQGWQREFLLTRSGAVSSPTLRAVAWPEPDRAFAVGDLGAMWMWRAETGLWEKDPAAPLDGFQGNLLGIAFDPSNPALGYAVGLERRAAALRQELDAGSSPTLPKQEFERETRTSRSVAFAGSEAMVAADTTCSSTTAPAGRSIRKCTRCWPACRAAPQLNVVAGLPNGGAVLAGHDVVLERDSAGAPWHFSEQPIVDETAVAAAPILEGSKVRALLSVVPDFQYPPPLDPAAGRSEHPAAADPAQPAARRRLPAARNRRRLGGRGARRLRGRQRGQAGQGRPDRRARPRHRSASGWARRWLERRTPTTRGAAATPAAAPARRCAKTCRRPASTATRRRAIPRVRRARPPRRCRCTAGVATFAVAGHAECAEPCADLADEAIAPDRNLSAALSAIAGLAGAAERPAHAALHGRARDPGRGPRVGRRGRPLRAAARRRRRPAGVPGGLGRGFSEGGERGRVRRGLRGLRGALRRRRPPAGVSTANIPRRSRPPSPGARTHYAFDSTGPAGRCG